MDGRLDATAVQPASLAAVAIDPATARVVEGDHFDSLMCPDDEGWQDRVDPGALFVNKLRVEDIEKAPPRRDVWLAFARWVRQYNPKKGVMSNPVPCGKNIRSFDNLITEYLSRRYGTVDKNGIQTVFARRPGEQWGRMIDLDDLVFGWFEGSDEIENLAMDTLRSYFGLSSERAHSAIVDVYQSAEMICRFLRLHRGLLKKIPFRNSMRDYRVPV